jgi:hypothetical protein
MKFILNLMLKSRIILQVVFGLQLVFQKIQKWFIFNKQKIFFSNNIIFKGDDSVVICKFVQASAPSVESYYNRAQATPYIIDRTNPTLGITNAIVIVEDNIFTCNFTRQKTIVGGSSMYFDLNNKYHIIGAYGEMYQICTDDQFQHIYFICYFFFFIDLDPHESTIASSDFIFQPVVYQTTTTASQLIGLVIYKRKKMKFFFIYFFLSRQLTVELTMNVLENRKIVLMTIVKWFINGKKQMKILLTLNLVLKSRIILQIVFG